MRSTLLLLLSLPLLAQSYKLTNTIKIGGAGGWDYLYADSDNRRLYVSHGDSVVVLDLDSEKQVGTITGLNHIHGIVTAPEFGVGFITEGGANDVAVFDLKSLAVKTRVKAGTNPDGMVYDPASKRVFAFNGRSGDATAIDAEKQTVAGTIKVAGKPEFPVADGRGNVYDNIEDKSVIQRIDSKNLTVTATWPVAPCESPSGLAIDTDTHRLFAVCDGGKMAVVDADSGKVIATPAIGDGPDAAGFDPGTKLVFSSNGSGTVTVVKEIDANTFKVVENVPTQRGARTMALDTKTHKIYLATADFGAVPAGGKRPSIVPDSFRLLVLSQQ